jgi:hypothetical protein
MPAESPLSLDQVLDRLRACRAGTLASVQALTALGVEAAAQEKHLESPAGVREYLAYFLDLFGRIVVDLDRVVAEMARAPKRRHVEEIRQIASNAGADSRRCLQFRDKWINRPLPYEQVRPMLSAISNTSRDQLAAYRELFALADRLHVIAGLDQPDRNRAIGRRALFERLIGRDPDDD